MMADPLNILHTVGFQELYPIVRAELQLSSSLDQDRLIKAVQQVHQIIPELVRRYDLIHNQFVNAGFTVHDVVHFVDHHQERVAGDLDWQQQPQWAIYVSDQQLIVYGSHILFDGAGFKELLYLLAAAYNHPEQVQVRNHQDIDGIKRLVKQVPSTSNNNDHPKKKLFLPKLANPQSAAAKYQVIVQRISADQFQKLHERTHAVGITLNDLFMAAFGKAVQQYSGIDEINLACPTDMRQYLSDAEQDQLRVQNLTGRYNVGIKAPLDESLLDTAIHIHENMNVAKEQRAFLESFRTMLNNLAQGATVQELQSDVEQHYHVREIAYTNMAIIDEHRLAFDGIEVQKAILSGGFRRMPHYQICVNTFKKQLSLVANVIGTPEEIPLARSVMTMMRLYLLTF